MLSRKPDRKICSDVAHLDLLRTGSLLAYGIVVGRVIFFVLNCSGVKMAVKRHFIVLNCSGVKMAVKRHFIVCRITKSTTTSRQNGPEVLLFPTRFII